MKEEKICPRCYQAKHYSEFLWPDKRKAVLCKACRKAIWQIEQNGAKMYSIAVPEKKKYSARKEAQKALRRGILNRPYCCETCGKECYNLNMHHFNYDKPLAVIFVCESCHNMWHERYYWIDRCVVEKFNIDGSER